MNQKLMFCLGLLLSCAGAFAGDWAKAVKFTEDSGNKRVFVYNFSSDHKVSIVCIKGTANVKHPIGTWEELPSLLAPTFTQAVASDGVILFRLNKRVSKLVEKDTVHISDGELGLDGEAVVTSTMP